MSREWSTSVASVFGPTVKPCRFSPEASQAGCSTLFGSGTCKCDFKEGELQAHNKVYEELRRTARWLGVRYDGDGGVDLPPLQPIVAVRYGLPGDKQCETLLMIPAGLRKPYYPIFLRLKRSGCADDGPYVRSGDIVVPDALHSSASFMDTAQVTTEFIRGGVRAITVQFLRYEVLALLSFRITELNAPPAARPRRRTAKDPVLKLLQEWDRPKPSKKRNTATGEPRASRPASTGGRSSGHAVIIDAKMEQPVDCHASSASSEEDSDDEEDEPEPAPPVPARPLPPPADLMDIVDDPPGPDVVAAIDDAHRLACRWNPDDFQVRNGDGTIIGRVKPIRPGLPDEAISSYCRLHQCAPPLIRVLQAPATEVYVEWLELGQGPPAGQAGRAAHMNMFRRMRQAAAAP